MGTPLESLVACGTKVWLDSIDPELVRSNRQWGATGATSNPIIVAGLIQTGRFDDALRRYLAEGCDNEWIAWRLTDELVRGAQEQFADVWQATAGNDGYVSFELDPLIEDPENGLTHEQRVERYIEEGQRWAAGHQNRMIKVPATPAGLGCLEALAASGVTLNVTLLFTERQYREAREAVWRGAQKRSSLATFKSVYSIFVSRLDVYTGQHVPQLSPAAQGMVGIVNAKRIWALNQEFWRERQTLLQQEIIFASTGTKKASDPAWKYVEAFAGSDIETNPPETNAAVQASGMTFTRHIDELPAAEVLAEIDREVNLQHLEETLMREGVKKFADPQKALLALIETKRREISNQSR